ncbi:twitching motility protein PilT [Pararhizobium polonicum]|uniref:Twitching motility protein PilT n=1 Tax=Pararhizobium polonicum TaxID=1612624 RepID=A0A1C7NUY4_9HYPH|nr:PIN domain-containing protein [Pararhizobium polonicum]OBZ92838.1 twitching motility protein PilT [Pararhizobium polonicum]
MTAPLLDTNILVYAFTDDPRSAVAQALLSEPFILSVQALNEFSNVARRKLGMSWMEIQLAVSDLSALAAAIVPIDKECNSLALDLAARYNFSVFDALMIASALQAGSAQCFSEDMQNGLMVDDRLVILNPFLDLER